jgi:hypothetical protein
MARVVFVLLLACLPACVHSLATSEARWVSVQSAHFQLYTDLDADDAEAQARDLERALSSLLQHGWGDPGDPPILLNVVMFRRHADFERYAGTALAGYHVPELLFEPWIVMPVPNRVDGLAVLRHELTHYIAHQVIQVQPQWFAEGLACYFETARMNQAGRFEVGAVPMALWNSLRREGLLPAARLFTRHEPPLSQRFYATSWALVHYLVNEHSDRFVHYQDALARGTGHAAAWAASFPELHPTAIDLALHRYVTDGRYARYEHVAREPVVSVQGRTLSYADQLALEGMLSSSCPACGDAQRAERAFAQARGIDSLQVQAAARDILQAPGSPSAKTEARSLVSKLPDSWLAQLTLAVVLVADPTTAASDEAAATTEALRLLAPRQPYTWLMSAVVHATHGHAAEAKAHLTRAERLAPTNPKLLSMAADVMLELGECESLFRTVAVLDSIDDASARLSDSARERLRARCPAPSPAR